MKAKLLFPLFNCLRKTIKTLVVWELSALSPYFDQVLELFPAKHSDQYILRNAQNQKKATVTSLEELQRHITPESDTLLLLDGVFNYSSDIQRLLSDIKANITRSTRLFVVAYNPYFKWLYQLATAAGLREAELPPTFLRKTDVQNLMRLSGYSVVHIKGTAYFPFILFGLGSVINGFLSLIPFIRQFSLIQILLLRPIIPDTDRSSLSIIIPARNEQGNIEQAVTRLQYWNKSQLELIFVEGHSTDRTWEEILRVKDLYHEQLTIKVFQQAGKGKNDAVRLGIEQATSDLVTILDADLTVAPEFLERFYEAYQKGLGDFINGNRLLYAMEHDAMRFLNQLGNIFFAKALSYVLAVHIGDSLCGTKLFSRKDYRRFKQWRIAFGEFDPFGDFELLFPAALLGLEIIDVPVPYLARIYGSTNINRFRDGLQLLKMAVIGFLRMRMNLF